MKIKNIESKIKLTLFSNILLVLLCGYGITFAIIYAFDKISEERQKIYVIDNGVPVLVNRTNQLENREVEYKSHINMFHMLFFSLPPDDTFIKNNLNKAMYLIDESGLTQYNNLKEKSYYNQIISSSAVLSINTDSIYFNKEKMSFKYFATQRIDRKTSILKRQLITEGNLQDVPRTLNNPHGLLIKKWKTLINKDISYERKKQL